VPSSCIGARAAQLNRQVAMPTRHLTLTVMVVSLTGCAAFDPAVGECQRYLGPRKYSVVERVRLVDDALWRLARSNTDDPSKVVLDGWEVHWPRESSWGRRPRVTLLLLESKPDSLAYCEFKSTFCTPAIMWLKKDDSGIYGKWQLERTNFGEQICITP
jgi:hypothetical protein